MRKIIPSIKGTRDFYPEEMAARTWLYSVVRQVSESFGYQEYEAPILESLELYAAKSGEELVKEQSFVFPDRGGDLITLRPELTPSLARMVAQRQRQLTYPLRWWSFGPFWRYERPQKGRTREFFQWNIDLIGVDSPEADAELIAIVAAFFQIVGLTPKEVCILVNNRRLMDSELTALGIPPEKKQDVSNLIDRRSKLSPEDWENYAADIGLSPAQRDGLKSLLGNADLWQRSEEMVRLFTALESLGVKDYVSFDPNTIRGLLYYTGTVFEAFDLTGDIRRSVLGGGRYDNLLNDVGGDPLPAVGFAMGDVVISLVLEKLGLLPKTGSASPASLLVTVFDEPGFQASLKLAAELRRAGIRVNCYPEPTKLVKQFKFADRAGIRLAAVMGPDELAQDLVTIKDLQSGQQQMVRRDEAPGYIQELLDRHPAS